MTATAFKHNRILKMMKKESEQTHLLRNQFFSDIKDILDLSSTSLLSFFECVPMTFCDVESYIAVGYTVQARVR